MIQRHLNQTITVYSKTGYNLYGEVTTGSGTSVSARVELTNKNVLQPNGQVVTLLARVFVGPTASISIEDRVDFGSNKYKVFNKDVLVDSNGTTRHYELQLTQWQEAN